MEKDDEPDLVARYDVVYYPTFLWTDGTGAELTRTVQPSDPDELMGDLEIALEELAAADPGE